MSNLLVLNGPNLNLLGMREPEKYGRETLAQIEKNMVVTAQQAGHCLQCFQSNSESEMIERVHRSFDETVAFIILNPAAFTHTSIALRDAMIAVSIPFIEVHLSNLYQREMFRHHSFFSDIAIGIICGLGATGYTLALKAALNYLSVA